MSYYKSVPKREKLITTSVPNSPSELILQNQIENKEFSLEEIEKIISKLSYDDEDQLIFHLLQRSLKFHLFLLQKSKDDPSMNQFSLVEDISKLKIIKDLYESI